MLMNHELVELSTGLIFIKISISCADADQNFDNFRKI